METKTKYLNVANSYVHSGRDKITSLTVCSPKERGDNSVQLTFSDKTTPIRVKLSMEETAGLAKAIERNAEWKTYHTFKKENETLETRVQYGNGFINAERAGKKIALKLTEDEKASLEMTLKTLFQQAILQRLGA